MSAFDPRRAQRSAPDAVLTQIADFVSAPPEVSALAFDTASHNKVARHGSGLDITDALL